MLDLRVVAVVGAGVSHSWVPDVSDVEVRVTEAFAKDDETFRRQLELLEIMAGVSGGDPDGGFERMLGAAAKVDEPRVRDLLAEIYARRHPTLLSNELLAHLMKHRFIDGVISMNFDELLDQSILDEFGEDGCRTIVFERDAAKYLRDPATRDTRVPVLIKPHGTASERFSLRFSIESYYQSPPDMFEACQRLLGTGLRLVLAIGTSLSSFDIINVLNGDPANTLVVHLDPQPVSPRTDENIKSPVIEYMNLEPQKGTGRRNPSSSFTSMALLRIADAVKQECAKHSAITYRSTGRHGLVSSLRWPASLSQLPFRSPPQGQAARAYRAYLRDRVLLEVVLSTLRGNGIVPIGSLLQDRCGPYFDLYQEAGGKKSFVELCAESGSTRGPHIKLEPPPDGTRSGTSPLGPKPSWRSIAPTRSPLRNGTSRSIRESS
jgi:hypothetical protein